MTRAQICGMGLVMLAAGCGGGGTAPPAPPAATEGAAAAGAPATESRPAAAAPAAAAAGTITVTIGGEARTFNVTAGSDVYYTPLASQILAAPAAGGPGQFAIRFLAVDLKALTYPLELPPARRTPGDPLFATTIGFGYIDAAGTEWAGPGRVHLESFGSDGVLTGTFTDVSLPHTEKTEPNVRLADGRFQVRVASTGRD